LEYEPQSLRKCGADRYCLVEHDSFIISNGKWIWNSRGIAGATALDYLVKVQGVGFVDAVERLTGAGSLAISRSLPLKDNSPPKVFALPEANTNNDRVFAYLRGRGIDGEVIRQCIENGSLYETRKYSNCCFVGYDEAGTARFAALRGTKDRFMMDVTGSNKEYSFFLPPKSSDCNHLTIFESAIDALSHASLQKLCGGDTDCYRLSLGGVSDKALIGFLERHREVDRAQLCLDNDGAGHEACENIIQRLASDERFRHIKITVALPVVGKDFNEQLQAVHKLNRDNQIGRRHAAITI